MRVTPLDIIQKDFQQGRRGFDPVEVRTFLEQVRESLEEALKDNHRLRELLGSKDREIQTLRDGERSIKDTLVLARQLGDDLRRGAHREADVIVGEARIEAEKVLAAAFDEHRHLMEQVMRLRASRLEYLARMRALIDTHDHLLTSIEAEEPGEEEGL